MEGGKDVFFKTSIAREIGECMLNSKAKPINFRVQSLWNETYCKV